jgi:hypothetical protein
MKNKLMFRRAGRVLFWVALAALGVGLIRNIERAHAQSQLVDGSSVVLQEVITKPDGSKMLGPIYKFATRSDGSSAVVGTNYNPSSVEAPIRLVRLASGLMACVSDAKQQKTTFPISSAAGNPASPNNLRVPSSRCVMGASNGKEAAVGEEQVSGYRAEKITMDNRTSWYALDFGCALVRERFVWPDGSQSNKHLVLLRPGEPDGSLFEVPSSYASVPLSALTPGV